jgi:hypothetical protein
MISKKQYQNIPNKFYSKSSNKRTGAMAEGMRHHNLMYNNPHFQAVKQDCKEVGYHGKNNF